MSYLEAALSGGGACSGTLAVMTTDRDGGKTEMTTWLHKLLTLYALISGDVIEGNTNVCTAAFR